MSKFPKIHASHNPISPSQQKLCEKFVSTFGISFFEIIDATFFGSTGSDIFGFSSVFFTYNDANFTLSYEILGLDYGFLLACKDGARVFFAVKNMFLFWQQNRYDLDSFINALNVLSKTAE